MSDTHTTGFTFCGRAHRRCGGALLAGLALLLAGAAQAADQAPNSIRVYFEEGSAAITSESLAELDHAARLYRDGKPILMTVSAGTNSTGSPQANIRLSQLRAYAVFRGLVARGIPADRFQTVAKGVTDPAFPDNPKDPRNRSAQITWK